MLNESPNFLQPTHFTTTPGPSARQQYRAVFLFNRQIVLPGRACRAPEQVPAADLGDNHAPDRRVLPAGRLSQHRHRRAPGRRPASTIRAFAQLIGQMVPLLFPPIDPTRDDNDMLFLDRRLSGVRIAASVVD